MNVGSKSEVSEFEFARTQILDTKFRSELLVEEIPSPNKIATDSIALAAGVKQGSVDFSDGYSTSGSGRFILLYDPDSEKEWGAKYRVIIFAQAPLEEEIGSDKFISEVAWTWLTDALKYCQAKYNNISGTATNIISTGFGGLTSQGTGCQIELRASWTPQGLDFSSHASAWSHLLCSLAGFPEQEGTISMDAYRLQNKNLS